MIKWITTKLSCPKCNQQELVKYLPNFPGVDVKCMVWYHSIEVKSILAHGV